MLSSRYIHLHEALGLGPMWLRQTARVLPQQNNKNNPNQTTSTPTISGSLKPQQTKETNTPNQHTNSTPLTPARRAILERVGSKTHLPQPAPQNIETPTPNTAPRPIDWHSQLSGSIPRARVMVLSVCASPADVAAGRLFSGEDGELFQKMLNAIALPANEVYLSTWLKDLPDFQPKPPIEKVIEALPRVKAEYQLSQAQALLLLGEFFQRPEVIEQVHHIAPNVHHFIMPHPLRILHNPTLKRPAWETLQALQKHLANH